MSRKSFDQVLSELNYDVVELGALTIQVLEESKDALSNIDVSLAKKIIKRDELIDQKEMAIQEKWMNIIIREQPVASDLRFMVVVLKIITELERICDHGAKISKRVKKLKKRKVEELPESLIELFDLTIEIVKKVMRSYSDGNVEDAKAVYIEDDILDSSYKSMIRWLKNKMSSHPEDVKEYVDYMFISKYFERIGDRANSIAKWTVYKETGSTVIEDDSDDDIED